MAVISLGAEAVTAEKLAVPGIVIEDTTQTNANVKNIRELIDEFMDKHQELKELEEELQKNKDKLTPGQMGEA